MKLTKPQNLIYAMEKFIGGSVSNICGCILIKTAKSISDTQKAVNALFCLNDALRIRIAFSDGVHSQYVADYHEKNFEVLKFDCSSDLDKYASEFAKKTIDLYGDLCEIKIVVLPETTGILAKLHHIISDAWTFSLIGTQFYKLMTDEDVKAYSYTDYADSEHEYIDSKRYIKDKEFFVSQFRKCEEPIYVSDKPDISFSAGRKTVFVPLKKTSELTAFAKENKISLLTLFFTVVSIYMSIRNFNAEEFYIGTAVINRSGYKEQNTMGMFVNTVPVLVELNNNANFYDNLNNVDLSLLSVLRHQKYNYGDLLKEIKNNSNLKNKLYDVLVSYQNATVVGEDFKSKWYHNGFQTESLQIHIEDRDSIGALKIHYDYRTDKFTEDEIIDFHENLFDLLNECIKTPDKKITEISVMGAEKHASFNKTEHDYDIPVNTTLYSLFEKTAKENKEKICITTAKRELTFGELCCVSENLDGEIRKITGNTKSVIAVIAERSVEMYSAVYGVVRGGNAYLPIDPNYPTERIEYILKNSNAAAVICQGKFTHLAGELPCINMTEFINNSEKTGNLLPSAADENDTAYVIYTSGSTGNPKGARVSHKSAVNRILWMHEKYPLGKDDVILQKTPYTFDVSVWELFWWGMVGGCLAASKPDEHFLPEKILLEAQKNKVTHIHFVPSVFELFLNYLENHTNEIEKFNSVKYVFLSGEALSASLVNRFYKLYDYEKVTLHNLYGPTECAVDVTYYDCKPEETDPVPIGKPIFNTQMHVVDRYMNLVPVGVQGEICIAGMNVGQGYLNNPELTEEKFIDNPFGDGKLYKTGDLAYWRYDGNIVFCGRKDNQIKINGQRIEIGEIEVVISGVDGVDSVAVIVKKSFGKDMLIAFYTGKKTIRDAVRSVCMNKLPKYMVPSVFICLDKLPLNKNGKLDRRILNEYKIETAETSEKEHPENETERYICEVFGNVLNRNDIFRNTDFFDIGGTSLSMISVLSEKGFENITAAEFMRNSSPAQLSVLLNSKDRIITEYLEPLYVSDKAEKILILLPFAGGGAEAFSALVNSINKKNALMSVYYVRYLHSFEECKSAADEIAGLCKNSEIMFYSHCVGSAVALQIIKELEMKEIPVKHYFAGASIPPVKPVKMNLWNIVPDGILITILAKAGVDISGLSDEKLSKMLMRFRKDTDFANISFSELKGKIKTPVSVIISKKDMFTKNYRHARSLWEKYAGNVEQVYYIESDSHYFQSESSERLTDLIVKNVV